MPNNEELNTTSIISSELGLEAKGQCSWDNADNNKSTLDGADIQTQENKEQSNYKKDEPSTYNGKENKIPTKGYYYYKANGVIFYSDGDSLCWFKGELSSDQQLQELKVNPQELNVKSNDICELAVSKENIKSNELNADKPNADNPNADKLNIDKPTAIKLPAGFYFHTSSESKFYANGINYFCWFNGIPPNNEIVRHTDITPQEAGLLMAPNNEGRCEWDVPKLPEGFYLHSNTARKFYSNGINYYCWFSGKAPNNQIMTPTSITPQEAGLLMAPNNEGRCEWDSSN